MLGGLLSLKSFSKLKDTGEENSTSEPDKHSTSSECCPAYGDI